MDNTTRNALRRTVTDCREILEPAVEELLEGRYGIHRKDGVIEERERMAHLSPAQHAERERLLARLDHLRALGCTLPNAVERLIREAAFTHLNRLCAYRMLEERKLIRESVSSGVNSTAFKFYLAEHPDDDRLRAGGQQDAAYAHFIQRLNAALSEEIGVLFSPDDPAGALLPPQRVLDQVIGRLNSPELEVAEVWRQDETIGWVYQYFTPKDTRDKARKESPAPRDSNELAFLNQFYTPRYVVEFLVDNTLGQMWCDMRGSDSRLREVCRLLVRQPCSQGGPLATGRGIPKKDPRGIRILDPACGSGHFLLYCFDLLVHIYLEAYDDTDLGPKLREEFPSPVDFARQVPALILRHNLHGIDIDLRATQIAALALWLRAQKYYQEKGLGAPAHFPEWLAPSRGEPRPKVTRANIVCAEPMPGERDMLQEFVARVEPSELRGLALGVFGRMVNASEIGSLLKIEEGIAAEIADARERRSLFDESSSDEKFWRNAEQRLLTTLSRYADETVNGRGMQRKLFVDDAEQGFAFIDLSRKVFDVVLMNPPFGAATPVGKDYLKDTFPSSKHDLACAFVERWLARLTDTGRLGAITTRTPFFLSSSSKWREHVILEDRALQVLADLGYGVLDAMVETAAYVLYKSGGRPTAQFCRVLDDEDKGRALEAVASDPHDPRRFEAQLDSFSYVPGAPLCYWASDRIRRLFRELPPFEGEGRTVRVGLQTSDDFRFVRAWWEVPPSRVVSGGPTTTPDEFRRMTFEGKRWVPFAKGGAYSPYYADLHLVVNWERDGEEIRAFADPSGGRTLSRPQNTGYYFRPGITWSRRTTSDASFRCMPAGAVFADKGPAAFARLELVWLGVLQSSVFRSLVQLQLGAATAAARSYEVGLIQSTPVPSLAAPDGAALSELVLRCVHALQAFDREDETAHLFVLPALLSAPRSPLHKAVGAWSLKATERTEECDRSQRITDGLVLASYGLSDSSLAATEQRFRLPATPDEPRAASSEELDKEDQANVMAASGCSQWLAEGLVSYAVGCAFGRWDIRYATGERSAPLIPDPFAPLPVCSPGMLTGVDGLPLQAAPAGYPLEIDTDGIMVDDPEHPDDIVRKVREVLEAIWGDQADNIEQEACSMLGVTSLRDYFRDPGGFFDYHVKRYSRSRRRAPIYWLLQSPRRSYGLWLYYHRLGQDTLSKALMMYVEPKLAVERGRLRGLAEQHDALTRGGRKAEASELEKPMATQGALLSDLQEFRDRLDRAVACHLKPDLDDGVMLNMAPLHEMVLPLKETAEVWRGLLRGRFEWSSVAGQLVSGRRRSNR